MFRIDRNLVNLGAKRSIVVEEYEESEVGAAGEALHAAASATFMEAQDALDGAKSKSEEILARAKEEAKALLMEARDEIEEERQAARQEGFSEGKEEGRRSYDEQLEEKMRQDDEKLGRVIGELYEERERTYAGLEDEVVALAMDIVKKIINPDEEAVEGAFEMLIRNALRQIAPDGKIVIRVSTDEYERFFSSGSAAIVLAGDVRATASVLKDVSLNKGDCVIDTDSETINAGVDTQLKYVELAFEQM